MILRSRTPARRAPRRGFTLLEILLAAILAGLLLAALYAALYSTLLQTQVTRDAVEAEDLSRGVFNKITNDLTGTLAPLPPKSGGNSAASGGGVAAPAADAGSGSAGGAATAPATGSTGSGASTAPPATGTDTAAAGTTTAEPGATDTATAVSADYAFQGGVVGEEGKLTIYAGRLPESFGRYGALDQVRSDQRQIIYWMEPGRGLYRRERPWVTADGVRNGIEADPDAPDSILLAEEVTGARFEFSDGSTWTSTWDGTTPGPDGVTPLGPPRAIKVTLDIKVPTTRGEPVTKTVSQIIVVRSAPGTYTPPLLEAPTDGASDSAPADTSGASTGGTTGSGGASGASSGMGGTGGAAGGSGTPPSSGAAGSRPSSTPSGTGGGMSGTGGATPSGGTGGSRPSGTGTGGGMGGGTGGGSGGRPSGTGGTGGGR